MKRWLAWSAMVLCLSACASSSATDISDASNSPDSAQNGDASGGGFGDPCDELSDCASGLCYQPNPPDPGMCTQECDGQCPDGYECKVVMISDFTDVRVCVPAEDTMCATCDSSDDCGDSSDFCVELTQGYACTIDCTGNPSICPPGFTCQQTTGVGDTMLGMQCMPLNGLCCVDADGDLRGDGSQCLAGDCDDADEDIYDDAEEICDGKDNDCIGGADNDPIDCDPASCDLGTGAFFEQAREMCDGTACIDETPVSCGLYTCSGGGEAGDECADACDLEVDTKCVDTAHCDSSACLADLANGIACDEVSDCISSHCQNDFCCQTGDCCQVAMDCPTFGTTSPICDNPTACQGTRGEAVCNANFQCQSNGVEQDDSACTSTTVSDDCGFYLPVYCNGAVNQLDPACPTTCAGDASCDAAGYCNSANHCVEDEDDGKTCNDNAECKSNHCQNGYCCATGDCCSLPGNCPGSYSAPPVCDSQSTCQGTRDDASCINSICGTAANVADDSACTGLANDCGSYIPTTCTGGGNQTPPQCLGTCSSDLQCDANAYCRSDGICVPDNPDGFLCGDGAECISGHCQNGYCCASGDCCASANDCNDYDIPSTCTSATNCQGSRVDGVCSPTKQCSGQSVDDDSGCGTGTVADTCGPYPSVTCNGMASQSAPTCASSCGAGVMCDTGNYCDGTNHCSPTGDPGSACTDPLMCDSGLACTDDVCCNSSCTGLCRACDLSGTSGTCTNVGNGSDPDGECAGFSCASYYAGWVGDRCYKRADVSDADADCNGGGACRTAANDCPLQPQGPLHVDCNDTCQAPSGACSGTSPGSCTNLNLGNQTCGVGECANTVPVCSGGSPVTCVPDAPTAEICDSLDQNCDGNISQGPCSLPNSSSTCSNGTCVVTGCNFGYSDCNGSAGCETVHSGHSNGSPGENLGTYNADGGSCGFLVARSGTRGRYFEIRANEGSSGCHYVSLRFDLIVPDGIDYDLALSCTNGCSFDPASSSTGGTGADEWIVTWRNDDCWGNDDSFTVYVDVYYFSGASCSPWTLNIYGGEC